MNGFSQSQGKLRPTLMDRLDSMSDNRMVKVSKRIEQEAAVQSVVHHIGRILNVRKGSVNMDTDFGMPDISEFPKTPGSHEAEQFCNDMVKLIEKYEPRVSNVSVIFKGADATGARVKFTINAHLMDGNRASKLSFDTFYRNQKGFLTG